MVQASEGAEIHVGTVMALYTCITAGAPMQCHPAVQAIAGHGIAGDRYASNQGAYSGALRSAIRHVTLIAREAIDVSNCRLIEGRDDLEPVTRRGAEAQGLRACRVCKPV